MKHTVSERVCNLEQVNGQGEWFMALNDLLLQALNKTVADYLEAHKQGALPSPVPMNMKNLCISTIEARIEAMEAKNQTLLTEYGECVFLSKALQNGWLVSDIPMLIGFYELIDGIPENRPECVSGKNLIEQMQNVRMDQMSDRFKMLNYITNVLEDVKKAKFLTEDDEIFKQVSDQYKEKVIYETEYPNDKTFDKFPKVDKELSKIKFVELVTKHDKEYREMLAERDRIAREKEDYIFREISEDERSSITLAKFNPNDGQKFNDIKKSNKQVIEEVFGGDVYDEINEMGYGSREERKVPLHHSQGNKWQKKGEDVLQIEIAGSGAQDVLKLYKGRTGSLADDRFRTPTDVENLRGKKVEKEGGGTFDYIRSFDRTTHVNDKEVKRIKYAIAGASPDWWKISGLFNLGEYSIESSRNHARDFAAKFIQPFLEKWKDKKEIPHDIHISLSGHSRGAVTAGEAIKKINEWVNQYTDAHPEMKEFKKYIKYDLRLEDPVAGAITNLRLSSCDLRNIPNLNTTVFCSLGQDHYDLLFPLQHVKGAKKIVLTTTDHMMNLTAEDSSQLDTVGDGKKHAGGYYDAETGEMFRSSGMSELPDGVYISDENRNLIRVSSYSQVGEIFKKLYENGSPQKSRLNNIHHMVRDWFIENSLEMSFPDEETRKRENERNDDVAERILNSPNKRIAPVQEQIRILQNLKNSNADKNALIEQNKRLIETCRAYMKKTRIPAKDDSEYRVNLVSDTLSFTMKETNTLEKELRFEKGDMSENPLDQKIKNHRERMEKKKGFAGRNVCDQKLRLRYENEILKLAKETADKCETALKELDATRVGKITSEEYDEFHDTLVEGMKLGENSTIKELTDFYKRLTKASDRYILYHDSVFGPITGDGQKRLTSSKTFAEYAKNSGKLLAEKSLRFGDKNIPIGRRIEQRKADIEKQEERIKQARVQPKALR